jgi:fructokinase
LLEGEYIALGLANLISAYRPQRVVLGGGVMHDVSLMSRIRERMRQLLGDYFPETNCMDELVVGPALGDAAGVVGAILLAAELRPGHLGTRSATGLTDQIQAAQGQDQRAL